MNPDRPRAGRLPAAYLEAGSSSFLEFVSDVDPGLLPGTRPLPGGLTVDAPHGTTIVAELGCVGQSVIS